MSDIEYVSYLASMPTEVLFNIFSYLPAKQLTKCREVCVRWKDIIDGLSCSDIMWHTYCKMDFPTLYSSAWRKSPDGILWHDIYRSLSLWPKLGAAREIRNEFAVSLSVHDEVQDFTLLRDSTIGVHTKRKIVYYDRNTLNITDHDPIKGDFLRYTENDDIVVVMNYHLHLFVSRKRFTCKDQEPLATFDNVKMFLLIDRELYFVTLINEIHLCRLDDKGLKATLVTKLDEGIISLGYNNKHLNVLSVNRTIYTINENNLIPVCTLGTNTNLLHKLQEHNLLEQLDWRIYFQWMYVLNHTVPQGPLRDIITIRSYGEVFFVGSNWGVLRIYFNPYSNGELDLFNSDPIKQFNFMERGDCLSMWAILQVDVSEGEDGHTVFVAMPKKIAVIKFVHNFKCTASVDMLPN